MSPSGSMRDRFLDIWQLMLLPVARGSSLTGQNRGHNRVVNAGLHALIIKWSASTCGGSSWAWTAQTDRHRMQKRLGAGLPTECNHPSAERVPCYFAFGLRVRSELALPELGALRPDDDLGPAIDIRLGSVPLALPSARYSSPAFQVGDDDYLLTVSRVARYRVRGGREIIIEPAAKSSERNVRLFLLGTALGVLCHQRGLLPLHASAIEVDSRAVAFTGPSGTGKSTLAAHFHVRGYRVLCDDVCVVSFDDSGRPLAWPGLPRLKLWRDAVTAFGRDPDAFDRVYDEIDKYYLVMEEDARRDPVPLARLYVLQEVLDPAERIRPLTGTEAVDAVMSNTYRGSVAAMMGRAMPHFRQCTSLVRHARVFAAGRRWGFHVFAEEAAELVRHGAA
jgi:hypothetical protein